MAEIRVQKKEVANGWRFEVEVMEGEGSTNHKVAMNKDWYEDLKTDTPPEEIVRRSFEFLLDREPKESILSQFEITVIGNYFPEYKSWVKNL